MKDNMAELIFPELTSEEQKEFNFIQGKIHRRGILFPHEVETYRRLKDKVLKNKRSKK